MPLAFEAVYDAIVLAGGSARRLDRIDKTALAIGGVSLLERVLAAVTAADRVVVVGERRPLRWCRREVGWCREDPPGGGPVAALAAGLPHTSADVVIVLAADLPWIAPAVAPLVAATPADGVAELVDRDGRRNHLAAAWRRASLAGVLDKVAGPAGVAMRQLVEGVQVVAVPDAAGWGADCDTWADVAAARARAAAQLNG